MAYGADLRVAMTTEDMTSISRAPVIETDALIGHLSFLVHQSGDSRSRDMVAAWPSTDYVKKL